MATSLAQREHQSVACLRVTVDLQCDGPRLLRFTRLLRRGGGAAIHVETSGIAHAWERWFALVVGTLADHYRAAVSISRDGWRLCSVGMQRFGLPDCSVIGAPPEAELTALIHQFNCHRLTDHGLIGPGRYFSVGSAARRFRMSRATDLRQPSHAPEFNVQGLWLLREEPRPIQTIEAWPKPPFIDTSWAPLR